MRRQPDVSWSCSALLATPVEPFRARFAPSYSLPATCETSASVMEPGNTTFPTPSIFTMRLMAVSLPAFPGSVFESTNQQERPFSDLDRRYGSHLVSALPQLQC